MKKFGSAGAALSLVAVCAFTPACSVLGIRSTDPAATLSGAVLRAARVRATLLGPMGDPVQYAGWNKAGDFKKITETEFISVHEDGKTVSRMMFRPLLIPGAPWMAVRGEILIAARKDARVEKAGEESFHAFRLPGQQTIHRMMWKTTETNGKWVAVSYPNIYVCGEDGAATQIGSIAYRELAIESGEVVKLHMTKSMAPGSAWEGDVADTTYREASPGKGTAVAKLAYRPVKLADGTETVILMSRPLAGDAPWTGVRNGKVIEAADK